jgi:hypothetical protein
VGLAVLLTVAAVIVVVAFARRRTRPLSAWSDDVLLAELRRRGLPPER